MGKFVSFLRGGPVPPVSAAPEALSADQRSAVFAATGMLLSYPESNYSEVLGAIEQVAAGVPDDIAAELTAFTAWARRVGTRDVETAYVSTFDQKRRCALELTYYATGDTRQRGIALTVFADLYAALGWDIDNKELPDFLPNLLELAARTREEDDMALIGDVIATHREGIEILHSALAGISSPWVHVVAALRMVLPAVDELTAARLQKLIRQGPPQELVGTTSSLMPWPTSTPGARAEA